MEQTRRGLRAPASPDARGGGSSLNGTPRHVHMSPRTGSADAVVNRSSVSMRVGHPRGNLRGFDGCTVTWVPPLSTMRNGLTALIILCAPPSPHPAPGHRPPGRLHGSAVQKEAELFPWGQGFLPGPGEAAPHPTLPICGFRVNLRNRAGRLETLRQASPALSFWGHPAVPPPVF